MDEGGAPATRPMRRANLATPLRVLTITNMWPTATRPYLGVFVARQVEGLRAAGVDIDVLAIDGDRPGAYRDAARRVLALNRGRRRYDLIHAHTGHSGALACLQVRYPVVCSYVGYDLDAHLGPGETLRRSVERRVFRSLALLFAGTITKTRRGAARIPRGARRRNHLVPNGVDRRQFVPMPRAEARRQLGWAADAPVVLFGADPDRPEKCYPLARAAADIVSRRRPEVRLLALTGVEPATAPLWFNASDVLLLTSVAEGSPNVVKEALACNLPVVSTDVGDVSEQLDGVRLSHVRAADPAALAEAVEEVLSALPERSDGRARSGGLALEAVSERVLAAYAGALGRGPGPLGFLRLRRP